MAESVGFEDRRRSGSPRQTGREPQRGKFVTVRFETACGDKVKLVRGGSHTYTVHPARTAAGVLTEDEANASRLIFIAVREAVPCKPISPTELYDAKDYHHAYDAKDHHTDGRREPCHKGRLIAEAS